MAIYKPPKSPYWQYDFETGGHRFFGSTKTRNKRDAEKVEAAARERAKQQVAQAKAVRSSLRLDDVCGRYWSEVGKHHERSDNTWHQLDLLLDFFGKDRRITDINDDDLCKLVAWRRGHHGKYGGLLSPFSVNDTTEQLKKILTRAKKWGARFECEPQWRQHWLKEPQERVRELVGDEGERLEAA